MLSVGFMATYKKSLLVVIGIANLSPHVQPLKQNRHMHSDSTNCLIFVQQNDGKTSITSDKNGTL